jgi:hypothetical protein
VPVVVESSFSVMSISLSRCQRHHVVAHEGPVDGRWHPRWSSFGGHQSKKNALMISHKDRLSSAIPPYLVPLREPTLTKMPTHFLLVTPARVLGTWGHLVTHPTSVRLALNGPFATLRAAGFSSSPALWECSHNLTSVSTVSAIRLKSIQPCGYVLVNG